MYKLLTLILLLSFSTGVSAATVDQAFSTTVTQAGIQADYLNGEKVKVLVMPGHEPSYGGAVYKELKERDIAVEISNALAAELRADPRFEVTVARDTLSWNEALLEYFEEEWKGIQKFVKDKKREMQRHIRRGNLEERTFEVAHNTAATDVALRLYGISKWANENDYDIAIHVHLNDNLGHNLTSPGLHSGFAVYVPDPQYGNGEASAKLGEAVAFELNHFSATSTLPIENYGIVPDQELIALGAFNTAEFASVLVEYGYIYESKITHPESRPVVVKDLAHQTYRGIQKFVGATPSGSDTLALPYPWVEGPLTIGSASAQAYALQVALHKLGFYPPQGELFIGCPISGYVGECTVRALKNFQASKGFEQTGSIGPRTKAALQAAGF